VQNQIEHAGVATISMTVQPHITAMVGAPRAVFLPTTPWRKTTRQEKERRKRARLRGDKTVSGRYGWTL
jgi:hypothetical protein